MTRKIRAFTLLCCSYCIVVVPLCRLFLGLMVIGGVAIAQNAVPMINEPLVPDVIAPGGKGFTLTVNGTGFVSGSVVHWNNNALATKFVSDSLLTASVPSSYIAKAGTASVTVVSPVPDGGTSNLVFFPIALPIASLTFGGSASPTANGPMYVATGDFNRDGKLDLVVTDPGSGYVSILLGNGNGTFQAPVNYTVGKGASLQFFQVAVGDFNGDGKLDFVVSDFADDYVSVFLGNGNGTFQPGMTYDAGQNPSSVTVADLKGDGQQDIVVSNQTCNNATTCTPATVSILLGNGDGTFQPHVDIDAGLDANWVMVGDFNRDGKLDLAVVDGQGNALTSALLVLLGNGDGTFQPAVSYPLNTNAASGATADFNRDGKLDIAIADNVGLVSILLGNGDGTFQPRVDYSAGSFPWGSLGVGDFNGDGKLDVAVANSGPNSVSLLLGNGDGTFQSALQFGAGDNFGWQGLAVGDFNQDGGLDLAVADYKGNTVSILLQSTTATLSPATLAFPNEVVGSTSATQTLTLSNSGSLDLTISAIGVSGTNGSDFSQNNNCGLRLVAGAKCTIDVAFKPTKTGPRAAAVMITGNAVGSPLLAPLSGTGVVSGPNATLSPTSLAFATQLIGTTSAAQSITLGNYGTMALSISSVATTGNFSDTSVCGSSLAAGATCQIAVTFKPTTRGSRTGTLTINDNAPGSPETVSLSGTGTVVELNPASLSFGTHLVGTSSTQSTTLTNSGSTALSITGITITGATGNFSQTNNCGTSVAAGASCSINVTFKATAGAHSADISVSDNGGASPQKVSLSGSGYVCIYNKKHRCLAALEDLSQPAARAALATSRFTAAPGPTGPSAVGTRVLRLVDGTRNDPYAADGSTRELLVRFWYPASVTQSCTPAEYTSPKVWSYFSNLVGIPLPEVRTNSCLDALVAGGSHPVVVFTHGYTGTFTDYTFLLEDLASRGYVVASVDHTYEATAVEFPDGRFVEGVLGSHFGDTWRLDDEALALALAVRTQDLKFVVDEIERLNAAKESPFADKLDTSRIGLMGHSLGGQATLSGVQQESRFRAGVLLDASLISDSVVGIEKPILILAAGRKQWSNEECLLWSDLRGPRLAVNLKGAEHLTPSDAVWLAKGAIKTGDMGPEKTVAAVRDYIAAFLDTNLRGNPPDSLLTGASAEYSDVVVTTKKQSLCGAVDH